MRVNLDIFASRITTMINLVLFGKPGAGKGTQAAFLKEHFGLFHISTGDLFRHHIKNGTPLGKMAQSYMDKGDLVPDQVTIDMLENAVDENPEAKGFIFDGFPRTTAQAEALDTFLATKEMTITGTIALEAPDDMLIERLLERGKDSGRADDQDTEKSKIALKNTAPKRHLRAYYQDKISFIKLMVQRYHCYHPASITCIQGLL